MDEQNKKYIIIGIVIIVVAIIAAVTVISTSSNGDGTIGLNIPSSNIEITNVDQTYVHSDGSNGNSPFCDYRIEFSLENVDTNQNYTIRANWYDMDGKKVMTDTDKIDYRYVHVEGGTINQLMLYSGSKQPIEISNCTIQVLIGNSVVKEYNYEWVNTPNS